MKNPCHHCDHRTITCHGVCKEYKDWQAYNERRNEWLRSHRPAPPEGARKALTNKIKQKARGWNGKRGSGKDYGG